MRGPQSSETLNRAARDLRAVAAEIGVTGRELHTRNGAMAFRGPAADRLRYWAELSNRQGAGVERTLNETARRLETVAMQRAIVKR